MWKMNDLRKTTAFIKSSRKTPALAVGSVKYDSYVNNGTAEMSIKGHLIINE